MTDDFDINKLAAHFAQENAERFASATIDKVKALSASLRARIAGTYGEYLRRALERYGRGRSFFIRSEATPLYDFFVPLDLTNEQRRLERPEAADLLTLTPHALIVGTGGSGKSMMMRHLLVSCIRQGLKTPVFIELRQVNQSDETIATLLLRALQSFGLSADAAFVDVALKTGQFLLLLDGYDELERSARGRIAKEVQRLAARYPANMIVMSSRADDSLQGWEGFVGYEVAPLELGDATELVTKLPFDQQVKAQFIADIEGGLFEAHKSFLSNPLLLSIMLLTYSDVAHIPHKLSTFYSLAFEALFHRHDALKSGFQREKKCHLDIQEYARAFAAFCLLSYDRREFAFSRTRALDLVRDAGEVAMLTVDPVAFLDDTIQANCLLLEEGLNIVFAHRSFQEYFVARFINTSPPEVKARLVVRYAPTVSSDAVMALLWEIDPYIVEKHYLLPAIAKVREAIGAPRALGVSHLHKYLQLLFVLFSIAERDREQEDPVRITAATSNDALFAAVRFALTKYRTPEQWFGPSKKRLEDGELLQAFRSDHGALLQVPSASLKKRGKVLRLLAQRGMFWGLGSLRALLEIEREIQQKHDSNRESLDSILSTGRASRRLLP